MKLLLSTLLAAGAISAVTLAAPAPASARTYGYYGASDDSYRQYCRDEWYYRRYEYYCSRFDRDNDRDYDYDDYDGAYDNGYYDDDDDGYYNSYYDNDYYYDPSFGFTYDTYDRDGRRHHRVRNSNYNYDRSYRSNAYDRDDRNDRYDQNDRSDGYDRGDRTNTRGTTRMNPSWGEGSTSNNSGSRYMDEGRDQAPENTNEDTVPGRTQGNTGGEGQGNDSNSYTGQRSTTH